MEKSKCTPSLSVATPSIVVYFENTATRVSLVFIILTRFVIFCVFLETVLFFVVCGGLVFLFFVAPSSLAVFNQASVFNQDVSEWNTGAVTTMEYSKCTSLFLSVAMPSAVVYF